jgi:2',3'-cyclic-nucleotide 2'-phosphodiesterase (5'-nucleotidase family)
LPVRVLVTTDEHGDLAPEQAGAEWVGGAAEMLARWRRAEGYAPGRFLVVSCGDIATGGATATLLKGAPVIAAMNLMRHDVAVVGNHDLDFGLPTLAQWRHEARFPLIAGNLLPPEEAGEPVGDPYMLSDEQGVRIGVVGLTTTEIPQMLPLLRVRATDCEPALRSLVARAQSEGAQVILVAAHMPLDDLAALSEQVADLRIPLMLSGHSHEMGQTRVGDTVVVNSGAHWASYARVDLEWRPATGRAEVVNVQMVMVSGSDPEADPRLTAEIRRWDERVEEAYRPALPIWTGRFWVGRPRNWT